MIPTPVLALLAGKAVPFARGEKSAIAKTPLLGKVAIGLLGIDSDEQADPRFHGGPDKALHHYPFDHYARWREGGRGGLEGPGAFGENISTKGLTEQHVCIGDRFRLGTSLIEVSQGRQPCWKQAERLQWPTLPALMVKERRSGWYYRVIEPGETQAGDRLELIERPLSEWTVARVFGLLIAGDHRHDPTSLRPLSELPQLFSEWRQRAVDLMRG